MAAIIELPNSTRHGRPARPGRQSHVPPELEVCHDPRQRIRMPFAALAGAVLLVLGAVLTVGGMATTDRGSSLPERSGEFHVVQAGDTMWSIAADVVPSAERAAFVGDIVALNGGQSSVRPGDVIAIPLSEG